MLEIDTESESDPETYAIIGAAMEVHGELRPGFAEPVYQEALEVECQIRGIPFEREKKLPLSYKGRALKTAYRADFLCFGSVLVECKALTEMTGKEYSQVLNYLRCLGLKRALLLNFGAKSLFYRRLVWSQHY